MVNTWPSTGKLLDTQRQTNRGHTNEIDFEAAVQRLSYKLKLLLSCYLKLLVFGVKALLTRSSPSS